MIESRTPPTRRWKLLQVESALACNLRCVMCPWRQARRDRSNSAVMAPSVWAGIQPHLPQIESVDFTGGGEPLLQPHLTLWVSQAHQAGCETGLLTNGLLLTRDKARALAAAGIDWIGISLDGADAATYENIRQGADFSAVCRRVSQLAAMRRSRRPKLMVNFVLMQMNARQLEPMVRLCADLGVDQINFKQCDVIRGPNGRDLGVFGPASTPRIRKLKKRMTKARRLAKKLGLRSTAFAFTPEEQPVCGQDPTTSMFVRHDGTTAPCINLALGGPTTFLGRDVTMPSVHYGRLEEKELMQLWEAPACRLYRQRFTRRIEAYEAVYIERFVSGAAGREATERLALRAMPEPPAGCEICHYLYDI